MTLSRKNKLFVVSGIVGFLALTVLIVQESRYPPLFHREQSMFLLSIYNKGCGVLESEYRGPLGPGTEGRRCDVFLLSDHDLGRATFSGHNLKYAYNQSRDGYDISGQGQITWGRITVNVDSAGVLVNGRRIREGASSATVKQNGSFEEDRPLRIF